MKDYTYYTQCHGKTQTFSKNPENCFGEIRSKGLSEGKRERGSARQKGMKCFVKSFGERLVIMNKLKTNGLCDLHEFTK